MKPLVILGSGGQAREIAWLIEDNNKDYREWELLGFISNDRENTKNSYPLLGDDEWLLERNAPIYAICAVGDPFLRERIVKKLEGNKNILFPTVLSKRAICADSSVFGTGTVICAGSIVTTDVRMGDFVICNPGCVVSHDSVIGDYVTMNAGVRISGNVSVGRRSYIGVNACTIQGIAIGEDAVIGAGATVINDIPGHCTAVGVPAKVIKRNGERVAELG